MYDTILNVLLFVARVGALIFTAILTFNLLADWRNIVQADKKNGLWATRIAISFIIGALMIENFVYSLAYLHGGFTTDGLNMWLNSAKLVVIVARWLILYGVIRLFILFCCNGGSNGKRKTKARTKSSLPQA